VNDDDVFIKKLYKRCMFASMLALVGAQSGQIVSAIIAGRLLESAVLSVTAVALPIQCMFSAVGSLLGVGGTVVCTRAIGTGRFDECHRTFTIVYLLNVLVAAVLAFVLLCFLDPLVRFLGAGPEIFGNTRRYVSVLIKSGVFFISIYPVYNLLRLDGRTGIAAIVFFVQALVTIILDLVFLVVFRRGVEAVALASGVGAAAAGISGAVLLFTGSKNFHFTLSAFRKTYRADFLRITGSIIVAGSPNALESLCILGYSVVLNKLIARSFGFLSLSSFKLIDSFNAFALIFIYAVSGPVVQFVGVFSAEKDSKSIRQLLTQVFKWGILFILVFTAGCEIFAPGLARLFGMVSPDTLAVAVPAIRLFALSLILALINNILICVYQGGNRTLLANVLTVSRLFFWIVITAPLLSGWIGVTGIWHSFWIAEVLSLLSAVGISFVYYRGGKYFSPLFLVDREAELKGVYKSFSVKNSTENITQSSAGITEFCEQNNLGAKLTMAISLAIEELLVVIHVQSLAGDDRATMNVRVLIEGNTVILRVRNSGKNFSPVDYVKYAGEAEEAEVMGIKMILALARTIDYRNTFGINNTTILLEKQGRT
jgi:Na+-driven multidrug efflux pump/anti-sigma regulatory factor (Ser/Thr protein kinase)